MRHRVVITGLGVVTSLSCKVNDLWSRVIAGESGVHAVQICDTSDLKIKIGGDVHDWNPSEYIDQRELKRLDRFTQFARLRPPTPWMIRASTSRRRSRFAAA